jgi:shikimate dehydrogenase
MLKLRADPVAHSLSPLMHNAAYAAAGLEERFVFVAAQVKAEALGAAMAGVRALGIRGVSCTLPHKVKVMEFLDEIDEEAKKIGAVNTILNEDGRLIGCNTDAEGVVQPLSRRTSLSGKRVALLGAGGAARAAVFGLRRSGAEITIFNRTTERAERLAEEAGCRWLPLSGVDAALECDIVVNMTAVGMTPRVDEMPLPAECLRAGQIVMDAVYTPQETRLLREAAKRGAAAVRGTEMFVAQGAHQFELYTGVPAPLGAMEQALMESVREERP